jgi:hypothetical protein
MLALQINDVKTFMGKLLNADTFDDYLLEEALIQTFNTFTIDGHMNAAFYTAEEREDPELFPYAYSQWKTMKAVCFQLIKGKKVPLLMKITLHLMPEAAYTLLEQGGGREYASSLNAFVVNIRYDQNGLMLTTGTSMNTFLMDKTPDLLWDNAFRRFLTDAGIAFEEI